MKKQWKMIKKWEKTNKLKNQKNWKYFYARSSRWKRTGSSGKCAEILTSGAICRVWIKDTFSNDARRWMKFDASWINQNLIPTDTTGTFCTYESTRSIFTVYFYTMTNEGQAKQTGLKKSLFCLNLSLVSLFLDQLCTLTIVIGVFCILFLT